MELILCTGKGFLAFVLFLLRVTLVVALPTVIICALVSKGVSLLPSRMRSFVREDPRGGFITAGSGEAGEDGGKVSAPRGCGTSIKERKGENAPRF